jgi:hypothetical protein
VSGAFNGFDFDFSGHSSGQLTLTDNQNDSATVELRGPQMTGFSTLPQQFAFRVSSGTGAWAYLTAQGTLTLTLQSEAPEMTALKTTFGAVPDSLVGSLGEQGNFTMSLTAASIGDASWWTETPLVNPLKFVGAPTLIDPGIVDPIDVIDIKPTFALPVLRADLATLPAVRLDLAVTATAPLPTEATTFDIAAPADTGAALAPVRR